MRRRQLQAAVGAAIVAIGLGASSLGAGATAGTTTATASPNSNLHNLQKIWVWGAGFPKGASVAIVQCNANVAKDGSGACDIGNAVFATATSVGRVPAHAYHVHTGTIGSGKAKGLCNSTHSCLMVVADIANQKFAGVDPITFAP